jgi:hypothetical protein
VYPDFLEFASRLQTILSDPFKAFGEDDLDHATEIRKLLNFNNLTHSTLTHLGFTASIEAVFLGLPFYPYPPGAIPIPYLLSGTQPRT